MVGWVDGQMDGSIDEGMAIDGRMNWWVAMGGWVGGYE